MISFPNAKINIGLNIVSKRLDNYHNLETIFYPVGLSDALEFVESDHTKLDISGIQVDGNTDNNLIIKAYRLLQSKFKIPELHFHLHKIIPFGAGLGGGSSDAAFTLKMLNDCFSLGLNGQNLAEIASQLGADCPFFIQNKPCFAEGTGNIFSEIQLDISGYKIVIVKPDIHVNTAEAYSGITPKPSTFDLKKIHEIPVNEWKYLVFNDFEISVFKKYPVIETIKSQLYELGAEYASMSGSGSAVYGIFRHLPVIPGDTFPQSYFIYR